MHECMQLCHIGRLCSIVYFIAMPRLLPTVRHILTTCRSGKTTRFDRLHHNINVLRRFASRSWTTLLLLIIAHVKISTLRKRLEVCIAEPLLVNTASPRLVEQYTETAKDNKRAANSTTCSTISIPLE